MKKEEAIRYLQQLYPNGGHCWLDEQRMEAIGMAVKALQEEPVSEEFEKEVEKMWAQELRFLDTGYTIAELTKQDYEDCARHFANWQKEQMMAKAFHAEIDSSRSDGRCILGGNFARFETGDKVKVIVIKED